MSSGGAQSSSPHNSSTLPNQSSSANTTPNPNPFSGEYGSRLPQEYMYEAGMSQLNKMPEVKQDNQVFGPAPPSPLETFTYKTPGYGSDTNEAQLRSQWINAMSSRGYGNEDIQKSLSAQNFAAGVSPEYMGYNPDDRGIQKDFDTFTKNKNLMGAAGLGDWNQQGGAMPSYAGLAVLGRQKMMSQVAQFNQQAALNQANLNNEYNQYAQRAMSNPNAGFGLMSYNDWVKRQG